MKMRNGNGWLLREREGTKRLYYGMCHTTTQGELQLRPNTETCRGRKRMERDRLKPKLPEPTFQGSLLTPSGQTLLWPPAALQQVQTRTFMRIELRHNKHYLYLSGSSAVPPMETWKDKKRGRERRKRRTCKARGVQLKQLPGKEGGPGALGLPPPGHLSDPTLCFMPLYLLPPPGQPCPPCLPLKHLEITSTLPLAVPSLIFPFFSPSILNESTMRAGEGKVLDTCSKSQW